jgi:hypothetical protein
VGDASCEDEHHDQHPEKKYNSAHSADFNRRRTAAYPLLEEAHDEQRGRTGKHRYHNA